MLKKIEILSPAGTKEALVAAVRSGADAVYFGSKEFSARRNAQNFSLSEIKDAVKYCHTFGVKCYLTLNISVKNDELDRALSILKEAYLYGIDAVIITDLGLIKAVREYLPDLELHASTQMTVNSPDSLIFLKDLGIKRVVLARELSKEEIESIVKEAKRLNMETEVFVHGALCMSLSGQCLLSSVLGTRSGNRGLCAGPCRLNFSAENTSGFDLSLKDLALIDYIDELKEMGVTSAKIEGRMKRPEYVAASTYCYKSKAESRDTDKESENALFKVFSRSGFTDGYYKNKLGKEMFGIRTETGAEESKEVYSFIHGLYRTEPQNIGVNISLFVKRESPVILSMTAQGKTVTVTGTTPQNAETKETSKDELKEIVSKLGNTPYYALNCEINLDGGLFVKKSELNGLKREAVLKLNEKRTEINRTVSAEKFNSETGKITAETQTPKIIAAFSSSSQIPDNLTADIVVLPLKEVQKITKKDVKLAVFCPKFTANGDTLQKQLKEAKENGAEYALCDTLGGIALAKKAGLKIIGGTGLNVFNTLTASYLKSLGAEIILTSAELSKDETNALCFEAGKGIFAYGRLPLMCLKNCPVKNGRECKNCDKQAYLTDRLGKKFPILCKGTYVEMLNSTPLYLADRLDEFSALSYLYFFFTTETKEETAEILSAYIKKEKPKGEFTRGLYYRKVE